MCHLFKSKVKDYIKGLIKKVIPSFGVFMGVLILLTLRHPASQQVYLVDSDDVGQKRQSLNLRSNEVRIQLLVIKLVLSAKKTETFTYVSLSPITTEMMLYNCSMRQNHHQKENILHTTKLILNDVE